MKKTLLSFIVIFTFAGYALHTKIVGTDVPVVLTPEPNKPGVALSLPTYNLTPTPTPIPVVNTKPTPIPTPPPVIVDTGKFKNGTYTGNSVDAYYGYVQVKAIISGGKITDVQFLDYPHDRSTSVRINTRAMPYLISEAIQAQDGNVDTVSGASFTSDAFRKSLSSALAQAKV